METIRFLSEIEIKEFTDTPECVWTPTSTTSLVLATHHRPRHRHSLEQTGHREEGGGGGQPLFVSGFVQKAWTDTAAQELKPVVGDKQEDGSLIAIRQ